MIDHDSEMDECAAATTAVIAAAAAAIAAIAAAAQANYSQTAGEQARTHPRVHVGDLAPEFLPRLPIFFFMATRLTALTNISCNTAAINSHMTS